jgi:hypothetical protein
MAAVEESARGALVEAHRKVWFALLKLKDPIKKKLKFNKLAKDCQSVKKGTVLKPLLKFRDRIETPVEV